MTNLILHKIFIYMHLTLAILLAFLCWQLMFERIWLGVTVTLITSIHQCHSVNVHWKRIKNIYQFGK
jgi:hypothetical protein